VKRLVATLATIWRLAIPYFRSDDRWPGRILLGAVIAIELSLVAIQVILNEWYNRFYNTLQDRNWNAFVDAILFFCVLATVYIVLAVYQLYLNQWLQIRWRRWMTRYYLAQWLDSANHYRMQLLGDAADNPDQRIAEDIRLFIDSGSTGVGLLPIGLGLLSSVVTLFSFVIILWHLSEAAPLTLFGWRIHGYLVWAAVVYSIIGTILTHLIGRPLIALTFMQQRYEADFRFNLVRTRENAEQIAMLDGEQAERERHLGRFSSVVTNWLAIMQRQKKLTFFTAGFSQASTIFPYVMVSPAYFSGAMQLGGLMQTASAFNSVQGALSYFVSAYRNIAEWRAVVERLEGFESAIERGRTAAIASPAIEVVPSVSRGVTIDHLAVQLPNGMPIVAADDIAIAAGDRVLVTGPSGAGKSTFFRAISGIWPFGSGRIVVPKGAKVMMLPQRPYFPVATLATAVTYPAEAGTFDHAHVAEAIRAVGLPHLVGQLDVEAHWNRMLSPGEQERLAVARALLAAPDYLFLDEATASLDEPAEAALYHLLHERLKNATIVSIGHRATLGAFHRRRLTLVADGSRYQVRDVPLVSAAE
jgi:vitamin B12/bleomycin/antimicrobial peptide transport system ATP-binding/permease protein